MSFAPPVLQTTLGARRPDRQGKVRDIYDFGDQLVIVATDRISAFDYVLGSGIPDKGKMLSQMSTFWFRRTRGIVDNHLLSTNPADYPAEARQAADLLTGRSMLVRRAEPLPIECVARGYLSGPAGRITFDGRRFADTRFPRGLRESDRLPTTLFTPATKAQSGHDINITEDAGRRNDRRHALRTRPRPDAALYAEGAAHAEAARDHRCRYEVRVRHVARRRSHRHRRDADAGFVDASGRRDAYSPGGPQPSFDKQFVRDYLESIRWNKQPPVPSLPDEVVVRTREKYLDAFRRLTGQELA